MKIFGIDIPDYLSPPFGFLVGDVWTNFHGQQFIRKKPRVNKPIGIRPLPKQQREYEDACNYLFNAYVKQHKAQPPEKFWGEQLSNLKRGYFDPLYWEKCTGGITGVFCNLPYYLPFSGIRNYSHPVETNIPTRAVYGPGTEDEGLPRYEGSTVNLIFSDKLLCWQRWVFTLENPFYKKDKTPIFVRINGLITAHANERGSRAMLSAIIQRWIVPNGDAHLNTVEPPTTAPISALWRYRLPPTDPPYFNWEHTLKLIYSLRSRRREHPTEKLTKVVILLAPMPMMGKRYNNNTQVDTTLDAEVEVWQAKNMICNDALPIIWNAAGSVQWWTNNLAGDPFKYTPWQIAHTATWGFKIALVNTSGKLFFSDRALTSFTEITAITDTAWKITRVTKTPDGWAVLAQANPLTTNRRTYFLDDKNALQETAAGISGTPSRGTLGDSIATNGTSWLWRNGTASYWVSNSGTKTNLHNLGNFSGTQIFVNTTAGIYHRRRRNDRGEFGDTITIWGVSLAIWDINPLTEIPQLDITASGLEGTRIGIADLRTVITIGCTPGDVGIPREPTDGEVLTIAAPDYGIAACKDGFLLFAKAAIFRYQIDIDVWTCFSLNVSTRLWSGQSFCESMEPPELTDSTPP